MIELIRELLDDVKKAQADNWWRQLPNASQKSSDEWNRRQDLIERAEAWLAANERIEE